MVRTKDRNISRNMIQNLFIEPALVFHLSCYFLLVGNIPQLPYTTRTVLIQFYRYKIAFQHPAVLALPFFIKH